MTVQPPQSFLRRSPLIMSVTEDTVPFCDAHAAHIIRFERALAAHGSGPEACASLRQVICHYFRHHGRRMAWRETEDPYLIFVSEVMLQQTQVDRVRVKYAGFIEAFPDFASLAAAGTNELLAAWQGMGYNRRALSLRRAAQMVIDTYGGALPHAVEDLETLPGIGRATASSIAAFAFNSPTVFIETNIRRVFIHFFFRDRMGITDAEILPLVAATLDQKHPREFYWGVMDYGTMLRKRYPDPNRRSATYTRQTKFEGSDRQIRGKMLRVLIETPCRDAGSLFRKTGVDAGKGDAILRKLIDEGFVAEADGKYRLR
ncbi:MAG: A/G-specific adenine glycosylase [Methanofollis sp.]|nr:A/G-specific adenine glycosylase [Methanofollis sp.]